VNAPTRSRRTAAFFLGFLAVALLVAGGLSYFASSDPDGLDTVALHGCDVVETEAGEQLDGTCIAQHSDDHSLAGSPLADYAVGGGDGTVGVAGVIGVVVTLAVAGGLFWLLRRRGGASGSREGER
jgi:cobalt/nickel transport protein